MTTKEWLEQLDESEYRIYREGFEAAKAAARSLCQKSEESLRRQAELAPMQESKDSLDSMAEACFFIAEKISQLQPEAHNG